MPLQNRVTPFGEFIASPARGTLMGNRGGRLHDAERRLTARRWTSKAWICCRLNFNNRHRAVWGDSYTELFFLDEVTAFAAGHRPCFECRRKDAERFALLFGGANPLSVRSRGSGNPDSESKRQLSTLGPRLRGDERVRATADEMDERLHAERLDGKSRRVHLQRIDALPDGAMFERNNEAYAVRGHWLLRWTLHGYADPEPRWHGHPVRVLTPPATLAVLARGYAPLWHPSASPV